MNNPIVLSNLCRLRNKDTDNSGVRNALKQITKCLLYEASKDLPTTEETVATPLTTFKAKTIDNNIKIVISPILRAGLIFTQEALEFLPQAHVWHIGMYRDEKTLKPIWYFNKVPKKIDNPEKYIVYLTDPMLATGGSLLEGIKLYIEKGIPIENIKVISIISAPEGIENIQKSFPNIDITTAAIDDCLNENGYIVPGLGDAGDRIFNT